MEALESEYRDITSDNVFRESLRRSHTAAEVDFIGSTTLNMEKNEFRMLPLSKTDVSKQKAQFGAAGTGGSRDTLVVPSTDEESNKPKASKDTWRSDMLKSWLMALNPTLFSTENDYRFIDFSPALFAQVRMMRNIDPVEYSNSFKSTTRERFTEGRSGSFLYFSADQKYIVKTTPKSEIVKLLEILPFYVDFLSVNPHTRICTYLGAYCITMYGQDLYFVVMTNIFPNVKLSERYDLKGSWVNRNAGYHGAVNRLGNGTTTRSDSKGGRFSSVTNRLTSNDKNNVLYQDNDLLRKVELPADIAKSLAAQIEADVSFLRSTFVRLCDVFLVLIVDRHGTHGLQSTDWSATETI